MRALKISLVPALCVLFWSSTPPVHAEEKVLIDTDFSRTENEGNFEAVPKPKSDLDFPLMCPTAHAAFVAAVPPSTSTVGKETLGKLSPPYALIHIKRKADEQLAEERGKTGFSFYGGFGTGWNFGECPLVGGVYRMSWTYVPLSEDIGRLYIGASIFGFNDDGTKTIVPERVALAIYATHNQIQAGGLSAEIVTGEPCEIVMDFNLNTNRWSVSVNGSALFQDLEFPESYTSKFKRFSVAEFQWYGGGPKWQWNDPDPAADSESRYAIGKMKLVRLSE